MTVIPGKMSREMAECRHCGRTIELVVEGAPIPFWRHVVPVGYNHLAEPMDEKPQP